MLDLKFLRENPEIVKQNIRNKFQDNKLPLVDEVIALDAESRKTQQEADNLRAERKRISKEIGGLMAKGLKEEAEAAKARQQAEEEAARKAAEEAAEVLRGAGVKHVIIKCGKRGCYIDSIEGKMWISPDAVVKSVDTTGAGDSFAAGFVYGISEGWDLRACAKFANQCGAKAVSYLGATTWCKEEL